MQVQLLSTAPLLRRFSRFFPEKRRFFVLLTVEKQVLFLSKTKIRVVNRAVNRPQSLSI